MQQLRWWAEARKPFLLGITAASVVIAAGLTWLWRDNRK